MVWIQIKTDALSVQICVQTVCKGWLSADAKVVASKERVNNVFDLHLALILTTLHVGLKF